MYRDTHKRRLTYSKTAKGQLYRLVLVICAVLLCTAAPYSTHAFFNNWMRPPAKTTPSGTSSDTPYGSAEMYTECQIALNTHKHGHTHDSSETAEIRQRCEILAAAEASDFPGQNLAQKSP